jgi:Domain of unknown function (DUF4838)
MYDEISWRTEASSTNTNEKERPVSLRTIVAMVILTTAFCLNASATEGKGRATVTLVKDGTPDASIVVAENPTASAHLAALELQYHIEKITGAVVPIKTDRQETAGIRILVGQSEQTRILGIEADDFKPLEYLIQIRPNTIVLIGRDWHDTRDNRKELGRSTYGDTLESYRNRIDYHKATGRDAQGAKPITLPGLFDDQGTCYATYHFLEQYCGVRWYGPTRLNVVLPSQETLTVPEGTIRRSRDLKHVHATGGSWPIIKVQWNHPNADELNLYWRRMRVGGEKWAGNHTIHRSTVQSIFNDPEYQAKGRGRGSQVCYTHPKLIQKTAQAARDYLDGKGLPEGLKAMGDYFAVVPDDNASWCQCDRCREVLAVSRADKRGAGFFSNASSSYYIFNFVNEVAKEVRKTHPDKFIATLAYASYAYRPRNLKLEPNISVAPCLHTCYGYDKAISANDTALYDSWLADKGRRIYLWNYFHHPLEPAVIGKWNCFPCFEPDVVSREVKRYHRDGVRGVFLCGIGQQLDYYLYMQTAFNVDTDGEALVDEFFTRYFGAAGAPMKRFYHRIAEINREEGVVGRSRELSWQRLGTPDRMKELKGYIEEAVTLAGTDIERQRVETWKTGVWDYMKTGYDKWASRSDLTLR